jgi:hypothetical protein
MGTGISRVGAVVAALILGLAGCGGSGTSAGGGGSSQGGGGGSSQAAGGGSGHAGGGGSTHAAFSWLHPQPPPAGWRAARIPTGATLAYPPNWRRQHSDPGTATAVLREPSGSYLGYVNLTPRQGAESLSNWSSFRIEHNADEGDRNVKRLAAGAGLRFLAGHGSCVKDSYTTAVGAHYVEIACIVAGRSGESVIVAAAPPTAWAHESATLEREIDGVRG